MLSGFYKQPEMGLGQKLLHINWGLVLILSMIGAIGVAMLYSAGGGSFDPWASRQLVRFGVGIVLMVGLALVDIRIWLRYAYAIYLVALAMLVSVEFFGDIGMGARRWINLGFMNVQPSEVMKIAVIVVLARYFHALPEEAIGKFRYLLWPMFMVLVPAGLVLRQPDLGTAIMLLMVATAMFFMAGVRLWKFGVLFGVVLAIVPVAWQVLKLYQKRRILTFLDPESDPLGAGYHILQSKIALGSGGLFGKGFMQGSQAHLNFLPEKQTDFIFTMLAEEFGLTGGVVLLTLYGFVIVYGFFISLHAQSQFGRLLAIGVTATFFLYVFINIAMVMGLVPVVGVPLPLISYGGTSMMTLLVGFGILIGVNVHRDVIIGRSGQTDSL
ncbi:MAG: rod shape-determining protein RodA [Rhodospirillales bacterium]|jgi:rod shape determining protein RodA|nr:rod shape-determining protein RodA [Rhodospirillales bacterium]MBT4007618.1 rod shape-determining protein RodA [Rhodospirillales bacterium]MBT5075731.1 rod shape-determining protein RodA [Rhodospirillales bacterium]MBT5113722.1 rod shape-determining protein RodA [Rhodospirillales bacterium]MBT5674024.1 rod shape-determining protein RodA [Rhodospirillales bacterium]